jgi:hypothetical protein
MVLVGEGDGITRTCKSFSENKKQLEKMENSKIKKKKSQP